MTRFWNYIHFFTFEGLNFLSLWLFFKPFMYIMPLSKAKKQYAYKNFVSGIGDRETGFNTVFALQLMTFNGLLLLGIACTICFSLFNITVRDELGYLIFGLYLVSYVMNYFTLKKDNNYLNYFDEFEKLKRVKKHYLFTVCYHLLVMIVFILTIYFIVGIG